MTTHELLAVISALVALAGVIGGAVNRFQLKKGIGSQFIRYNALVLGLPIAAALAFLGMLTEAAVSVILGVLAYVFPGSSND
ncbi:MAG: hypothetical protein AB7S74_17555 [Hyphomicrobium sp.]